MQVESFSGLPLAAASDSRRMGVAELNPCAPKAIFAVNRFRYRHVQVTHEERPDDCKTPSLRAAKPFHALAGDAVVRGVHRHRAVSYNEA